jgi:hypothetical protein
LFNRASDMRVERMDAGMLIREVERFLRKTGMPATKFGRLATNDPRFVLDLRMGRIPRSRTERRVEHFMNTFGESHNVQ